MATRQESATGAKIGKALTPSKKLNCLKYENRLKEYMSKKDYGALSISHTQQKFAKSHQRVRKSNR
jgi:hypothetical protein